MRKFSKWQKLAMVCLILALLFNPMTVEILDEYFKWAYTGISVIATVYVVGFLLYKVLKPEAVKLPNKAKKSKVKTSDYLEG